MNTHTQPWDRQPDENETDYAEFTSWLTNHTLHEGQYQRDLKNTPSNTTYKNRKHLSSQHQWTKRATAYDNHQRDLHHTQRLQHQQAIYDEHLTTAKKLGQLAINTINSLDPQTLDEKTKIQILKTYNDYLTTIATYTPTTTTTTTQTMTLIDTAKNIDDPTRILNHITAEYQQRNT